MEKFFLRAFSVSKELYIIHHQHICRPETFLKSHGVTVFERANKLVHEFFSRQIHHLAVRVIRTNLPGNRMHQMGFAKTNTAI